MLAFALRRFVRLTYLSFFKGQGTHARLTRKRLVFLIKLYTTLVPLQFVHWFFFFLDDIFFPGYRKVEVKEPLFILGNPRGGTTHALRLVSRDEQNFACPRAWELLFAPSITQNKIFRALARLDRRLGSPLLRRIEAGEQDFFQDFDRYHQLRMRAPDEDEGFFFPIFAGAQLIFMFPFAQEFDVCLDFDKLAPADRQRFMAYYKRAIQRLLYVRGPGKRFLSKAPSNSGRVEALYETFPDARIVCVVRSPLEVVPSSTSFFAYQWHAFCDPLEEYPLRDFTLDLIGRWYRRPLQHLERAPRSSYAIVKYDDLVQDPERTIADIYTHFGLALGPEFAQTLRREADQARRYRSQHTYSLEQFGYTREQIVARYQDIFDRFGFATGGGQNEEEQAAPALPAPAASGKTIVVFCLSAVMAHVVRPLEVGLALRDLGYRVIFAGDGQPLELARRAGFEVRPLPEIDLEWAMARMEQEPHVLHPVERIEQWVQAELALLKELRPVAILDDGRLTGGISAALAGLPRISITNAYVTPYAVNGLLERPLPGLPSILRPGTEQPYNQVRQKYGLPPLDNALFLFSGDLNLLCDIPEYAPVRDAPAHYRYVGPLTWSKAETPAGWLDCLAPRRPTLYFTMGSTGPTESFRVFIETFKGSTYQALITVGGRARLEDLTPAPPNFHLVRYAHGDGLADRADAVICHGGNGTTYQALRAGKPIVAWPQLADQWWNARRQAELGVGVTLPAPTPEALQEAVRKVLDNSAYREAAGRFRRLLAGYHGPQTAAQLIQGLTG